MGTSASCTFSKEERQCQEAVESLFPAALGISRNASIVAMSVFRDEDDRRVFLRWIRRISCFISGQLSDSAAESPRVCPPLDSDKRLHVNFAVFASTGAGLHTVAATRDAAFEHTPTGDGQGAEDPGWMLDQAYSGVHGRCVLHPTRVRTKCAK